MKTVVPSKPAKRLADKGSLSRDTDVNHSRCFGTRQRVVGRWWSVVALRSVVIGTAKQASEKAATPLGLVASPVPAGTRLGITGFMARPARHLRLATRSTNGVRPARHLIHDSYEVKSLGKAASRDCR